MEPHRSTVGKQAMATTAAPKPLEFTSCIAAAVERDPQRSVPRSLRYARCVVRGRGRVEAERIGEGGVTSIGWASWRVVLCGALWSGCESGKLSCGVIA